MHTLFLTVSIALLADVTVLAFKIPYATRTPAPPHPTVKARWLEKRGQWVEVCPTPGVNSDCKVIGVQEVTAAPAGHYVPECDQNGSCNWIGYAEPTDYTITDTTGYEMSTSNGDGFIIPIGLPVPPPEEPPIVPPPDPTGLPDPPEDPNASSDFSDFPSPSSSSVSQKSVSNTWSPHACALKTTSSAPVPTCLADGAPWFSPTSWCDCGPSATYPTLPAVAGQTSANCAYTSLPASQITPASTSAAPTNIPGQGGLPGCAAVIYPDGQACPYANYCNCGGTAVPFLTTTISGTSTTNCDYTIQPTANSCPAPSTTPSPSPTPAPSGTVLCAHTSVTIDDDSVTDLYPMFCGSAGGYSGASPTVNAATPNAAYHDIPNLVDGGDINGVWMTLQTARPGCQSATWDFAASSSACVDYMASISSACPTVGGVVTSAGCFDWGMLGIST